MIEEKLHVTLLLASTFQTLSKKVITDYLVANGPMKIDEMVAVATFDGAKELSYDGTNFHLVRWSSYKYNLGPEFNNGLLEMVCMNLGIKPLPVLKEQCVDFLKGCSENDKAYTVVSDKGLTLGFDSAGKLVVRVIENGAWTAPVPISFESAFELYPDMLWKLALTIKRGDYD